MSLAEFGAREPQQHSHGCSGKDKMLTTRPLSRMTLHYCAQQAELESWGATFPEFKDDANVRLIFQNVNGLPQGNENQRNDAWCHQFDDLQVDAWLFSEHNVNWDHVLFSQRIPERTHEWWQSRYCIVSHNRQDPNPEPFQPGSIGILV